MSEHDVTPSDVILVPVDEIPYVEEELSHQELRLLNELDRNRYDYREVRCPQCHAIAGAYCIRPSGHAGPFVEPHGARREYAHQQWAKEELSLYGRILSSELFLKPIWPVVEKEKAVPAQLSLF